MRLGPAAVSARLGPFNVRRQVFVWNRSTALAHFASPSTMPGRHHLSRPGPYLPPTSYAPCSGVLHTTRQHEHRVHRFIAPRNT